MPYGAPMSLKNEEVYALTAYLLHLNGIVGENDVMNAETLPRVKMPNRDGFINAYPERPGHPQPPPAPRDGTGLSRQPAAPEAWAAPRMPWGHPDLQGVWDSKTITPLQRPAKFAGREFLTDEEVVALEKHAADHPGEAERAEAEAEALAQGVPPFMEDAVGSCLLTFSYSGRKVVRTKRTSLIVNPPDGRIPTVKKPAARSSNAPKQPPARKPLDNSGPSDHPEDRPAIERCLGVSLPCLGGLCAFSRIVQSPDAVTIYYEQGHGGGAYRTIPLDGRSHVPSNVRLWLGDSVGRWEGDTLVVHTTNFTRQTSFRGSRDQLSLLERFTRVGPDLVIYRVTVEDATVFAKPWTLELTLTKASEKANQIFETACHEGNYSLTSSLTGARASDRENAVRKPSR